MSFFSRAVAVWAAWVAATWLLEGLPRTLLRPDEPGLRLSYAVLANLGIGMLLPLWLIRRELRTGQRTPGELGLSGFTRSAVSVAAAAVVGYGLFRLSHPRPVESAVLIGVFAQAWVVSAAEVLVCWALVGASLRTALRRWTGGAAALLAAGAASVFFGAYHFAHSPPFNEPRMVLFLTAVGLATSAWWLASRDILGTVVFHNFFAVTGVLGALESRGGALAPSRKQRR